MSEAAFGGASVPLVFKDGVEDGVGVTVVFERPPVLVASVGLAFATPFFPLLPLPVRLGGTVVDWVAGAIGAELVGVAEVVDAAAPLLDVNGGVGVSWVSCSEPAVSGIALNASASL